MRHAFKRWAAELRLRDSSVFITCRNALQSWICIANCTVCIVTARYIMADAARLAHCQRQVFPFLSLAPLVRYLAAINHYTSISKRDGRARGFISPDDGKCTINHFGGATSRTIARSMIEETRGRTANSAWHFSFTCAGVHVDDADTLPRRGVNGERSTFYTALFINTGQARVKKIARW